jgi:dTDP-4-dehydrorhamnose reductase
MIGFKKILVFGRVGQLAQSFAAELPASTLFLDQEDADFSKPVQVLEKLNNIQPDLVINCSAYTAVDKAEDEKELCLQINGKTPGEIASWCHQHQVPFVHFSTDYVFPGTGEKAWVESDPTSPINWYGESKRQGDLAISENLAHHLIFRISWVYSQFGKNFVKTMLELGQGRTELKVVCDQIGYPMFTADVVKCILHVLQKKDEIIWGTYHLSGPDVTSWHGLAKSIFSQAQSLGFPIQARNVLPVPSSEYPTKAKRPLNSRLNSTKFEKAYAIQLPRWEESLHECLRKLSSQG